MKKELEEKLFNKHPEWFEDKDDLMKSLMSFGFPGNGWFDIIDKLMDDIAEIIDPKDEFQVVQVKEKFGSLRFYYEYKTNEFKYRLPTWFNKITKYKVQTFLNKIRAKVGLLTKWERINNLVDIAELLSENTCEVCGKPGKIRTTGWWTCLCDEHNESKMKSFKE